MTPDDLPSRAQIERHLTEDELAERWQVSLRTLQRWRRLGRAPAHLALGRSALYRLTDVEDFEAMLCRSGRID